ncbi:hypothetical protein [Nocardia amikacinitolerans]|uniref:hypothetical protein n=1 Tax=Nocardia amikacinitolerans TaxID=756689 RepID=UPI0020A603EB|nr:hypothetical protein [Nocardia amikacinitolerans]
MDNNIFNNHQQTVQNQQQGTFNAQVNNHATGASAFDIGQLIAGANHELGADRAAPIRAHLEAACSAMEAGDVTETRSRLMRARDAAGSVAGIATSITTVLAALGLS